MGTIIGRTRKDGTTAYVAQILLKRKGQIVHRESQTFDRKQVARAWLARRETEFAEGIVDRSKDVRLSDVIDRYVRESERQIGRTKAQVLTKTLNALEASFKKKGYPADLVKWYMGDVIPSTSLADSDDPGY